MHNKISLRNLYFNRFLAIRYSTALFLFLNLYWAIFLLSALSIAAIIPSLLCMLGLLTMLEQVRVYRNHTNRLPYAQCFYKAVFISLIAALIAIYSPLYYSFYPFLKHSQNTLNILTILVLINMLITFLILKKLNKIKVNKDRHFKRIQSYEELVN